MLSTLSINANGEVVGGSTKFKLKTHHLVPDEQDALDQKKATESAKDSLSSAHIDILKGDLQDLESSIANDNHPLPDHPGGGLAPPPPPDDGRVNREEAPSPVQQTSSQPILISRSGSSAAPSVPLQVKQTQQQRKKSNKVRVVAQAKDKADDGASPKWRVRYMAEADVDEVLRIQRLCYEPEYRELPESYVGRIRLYPQGNVIVEVPVIDNDTGDSSSDDEGSNDHQEVTKYSPSSSPPEDLRALHSVKKRRVAPACGQWRMAGYIQAQPFLREGVNDVNDLVDLEKWLADHRSPSSKLDHERDVVYIHEIAMDPAFRGQGLTAPLTDYVQQLTEDEGFQMMTLVSLGPALGFWKRNGFVLCRQLDYGGHDCYYMEKPLPVTDVDCNQPLADR